MTVNQAVLLVLSPFFWASRFAGFARSRRAIRGSLRSYLRHLRWLGTRQAAPLLSLSLVALSHNGATWCDTRASPV